MEAGIDGWPTEGGWSEDADLHATNATAAAYHADVAAKHAASTAGHATVLAQWVQHLWSEQTKLQQKVSELEEWKRKTLDEMRKLREEHKQLRKKFGGPEDKEELQGVKRPNSMPVSLSPVTPADMKAPPGLDLPPVSTVPAKPAPIVTANEESSPDSGEGGINEGVIVKELDGGGCQRAEWRIGHLTVKLRGCMGRALVSPPFSAWGMEDLRLMLHPDQKESAQGPRSRKQKELYAKRVSDGPLDGCLKLKVPNCPPPHTLTYYLTIGNSADNRQGPFTHNFSECTVSEPADFLMDWLRQVDAEGGLTVSVDIMKMG